MDKDSLTKEDLFANGNLPEHIAIIMDGNGRWAKSKGKPRIAGHHEGVVSVREITRECGELDIPYLTLYTFSAENWRRPRKEVDALMRLLVNTIRKEVNDLMQNNVRLSTIGEMDALPEFAQNEMQNAVEKTSGNTGLNLVLALSYGGRQEILTAVKRIANDVNRGNLDPDSIDEQIFADCLYTANMPDPDLIVRTSGEARLSNFLLWQSAYAELVITDVMWPDFRQKELYKSIKVYQQRERRFGEVLDLKANNRG